MTGQQIDRDQLRALAAAATPGPWVAGEPRGWGDNDDEPQSDIDTPAGVLTWDDHGGEVFKPDDAEFIAAARNALPALLDALDQAEARIQAARDVLDNPIHLVDWDDPLVPATHVRRALDGER